MIRTTTINRYWERCDRDAKQLITTGSIVIDSQLFYHYWERYDNRLTTVCHYWERYDRDSQKLIITGNVMIDTHNS